LNRSPGISIRLKAPLRPLAAGTAAMAVLLCGCGERLKKDPPLSSGQKERVAELVADVASRAGDPGPLAELKKDDFSGMRWITMRQDFPAWKDGRMNVYIDLKKRAGLGDGGEIFWVRTGISSAWQEDHEVTFTIDGRQWHPKSWVESNSKPGFLAEAVKVRMSIGQLAMLASAKEVRVRVGGREMSLQPEQISALAAVVKMWQQETGARG
jgi:hypothetical protein